MRCHLSFRVIFLLSLWMCVQPDPTFAQKSISKIPAVPEKTSSELKLTPQQKRALRLLQSAQTEAAALQPDTRAYVLMQVADGYQKVDPRKADALLKEAFTASLSIEDMAPSDNGQADGVKLWLQRDILLAMSSLPDVEMLLSRAQPQVQYQVTESLISQYATKKDFDRARELIASLASQCDYPYEAAMQLMRALPPKGTSERVAVFVQALNAYRLQSDTSYSSNGFEGMSGMVMRFWHDVPPSLSVDAIDQILEQAKDASAGPNNLHFTFSGNAGTVALSSLYQYRLFQLLPVLEELDKPKAESLLRDDPDLRAMLDRFPEAQARNLGNAAEEYLEIGDEDDARKTVEEALKVAEKLYAEETDNGDHPDKGFKGTWPSTQLWRRCVEITARFSPSAAEEIIANIKDPEIATFEKIYFANSLLGLPKKSL